MQKLIRLYRPSEYDLKQLTDNELIDGWSVKQMVTFDVDKVLFLLEKESRKDKLDRLDDISKV